MLESLAMLFKRMFCFVLGPCDQIRAACTSIDVIHLTVRSDMSLWTKGKASLIQYHTLTIIANGGRRALTIKSSFMIPLIISVIKRRLFKLSTFMIWIRL